nr:uncharacterized protein LOC128692643 isoform X4 [Cherax quadricarinatus]XP_053637856.1 uncharacterized protein LOC128692643 isoform X4 [Cherax quadricarinatus]
MSAETSKNVKGLCCFCNVGHEQELQLGKLYTFNNISVHYYCLLFSSGLPQNGDDDEGIMGFLPQDIEKEIQRGRKLTCCYCFKRGATVGCSTKKCRRTYHYLCGLEHYAIGKFANDFRSYCVDHRDYQQGNGIGKKVECPICMEELRADPKTAVWAPCCKRNSWFHKLCLQKLALSAGYFFKCPLCNDKDTFLQEMQNVGIFVPEKDASWELEPNAFSDLLERPIHCDAPKCKCPDGRKSDEDGTRWEILLCNLCGSTGVHIACGGLPFTCVHWTCPVCADMVADSVKRMQQEDRDRRLKERNFKLKHDSQESTSYEKPSSSNQNMVVDVGDRDRTPYKRKLDVLNRIEKTPLKLNVSDNSTVLKITYESDSDNEIDIESGEYQISPHTIIRELEEHGEELPIQLRKLKGFAVQAQKRMLELRLTEADMVKMAKESPQYKSFCLDKSDITRFYRYSLPLEKMLQIVPIIKVIFAIREAVVKEAQSSSSKKQKRAKSLTPNSGRKGRNPDPRTPKIKIPLLKSALAQTLIASGKSSRAVGQCKMEEIGDSTSSDGCSMQSAQHFIKTEQSSFLDHSNVMSKVHKNLKDGVSETVFCISSNSAITDAASTLSPKSLKSSEEPSEISNTKLTVPVFPLQSDKFSASNEVKQDQDKVDKKNENRKNNTRITGINQETQTSGACRKLSLQFSASTENLDDCHFSSPSMFISLNSSARLPSLHDLMNGVDTTKMVDSVYDAVSHKTIFLKSYRRKELPSCNSYENSLSCDLVKLKWQNMRDACRLSDYSQLQFKSSRKNQMIEGKIMPGDISVDYENLKASEEVIRYNNVSSGRLFECHPSISKTWGFCKSESKEKNDLVISTDPYECLQSEAESKECRTAGDRENKLYLEKWCDSHVEMIKCDWGMYSRQKKSALKSFMNDSKSTTTVKPISSKATRSCVVALERLPLLNKAHSFKILTDNIVKISYERTSKIINIPTPALLKLEPCSSGIVNGNQELFLE